MAAPKKATKVVPAHPASKIKVTEEPQKRKPGYKQCPNCFNEIPARSSKCSYCNKEIPQKAKKATKKVKRATKPAPAPANDLSKISAAVALVEKLGGVEKAREKISAAQELAKLASQI
jgi:DNA repair exonuclease SbcCD ATPase subunit